MCPCECLTSAVSCPRGVFQVILGVPYGHKIDIWSLGCIMAELLTGRVLFQNDSVQTMLARMIGVIGDFPEHMMTEGKDVSKYFNSKGVVFEQTEDGVGFVYVACGRTTRLGWARAAVRVGFEGCGVTRGCAVTFRLLHPKKTSLETRLKGADAGFLSFVSSLLSLDPNVRYVR